MRINHIMTGIDAQYPRDNPVLSAYVVGSDTLDVIAVTIIIQLLLREWWFKKCSICRPKDRQIARALPPCITKSSTSYTTNVIVGDKVKFQSPILAYTLENMKVNIICMEKLNY
jgi:hypothetical protein